MSVPSTTTSPERPRRTTGRAAGVGAVAVCAALALTGCTSSGSTSTPTGSAGPTGVHSSSQAVESPTVGPTHPQDAIPADSSIVEVPALRKTILLTGCKATKSGWEGSGTAKNVTTKAQTYHLLVFFTDKYSRTIDYARTKVKVAPGATGTWTATRTFTPPKGTQCVLRGLYAGSAKNATGSGTASPTTSAGTTSAGGKHSHHKKHRSGHKHHG